MIGQANASGTEPTTGTVENAGWMRYSGCPVVHAEELVGL